LINKNDQQLLEAALRGGEGMMMTIPTKLKVLNARLKQKYTQQLFSLLHRLLVTNSIPSCDDTG
jgi:hypothetical protein